MILAGRGGRVDGVIKMRASFLLRLWNLVEHTYPRNRSTLAEQPRVRGNKT